MSDGTTPDTAQQLQALAQASASYIERLIKGEQDGSPQALQIARLAASSISNYIRHESVRHNHERTVIRLADRLASDPAELMRYISVALPDAGFVRALPAPTA